MNILIVDDEPFFIEELKRIIANFVLQTGQPMEVIGEAYSGEQALTMIRDQAPDAVFTDIHMAATNGLELSKTIKETWKNLPVVIVSGYPSFEYAREALRAEVVEYLLKPIDSSAVMKILQKLYDHTAKQNYEKEQHWLQRFVDLTKEDQIAHWLTQSPSLIRDFTVLLIRTTEPSFYSETWLSHLAASSTEFYQCWLCTTANKYDLLLFVKLRSAQAEDVEILLEEITHSFSEAPFIASIIYTVAPISVKVLKHTIITMTKFMDSAIILGHALLAPLPEEIPASQTKYETISDLMESKLSEIAMRNDEAAFRKEINQLFTQWKLDSYPNAVIQQNLSRVIRIISKHNLQMDTIQIHYLEKKLTDIIACGSNYEEVCEAFSHLCSTSFTNAKPQLGDAHTLYLQITEYLCSHLQDPISVNHLMELFYISRTNLWNLFRTYGETSFVEYLTHKRLERAKQLIKEQPQLKLMTIAEQVGYSDHHYFSRIFKSITGLTPSEYREQ